VSPVKYDLGFYIPEDDILHSHCRENLKSYIVLTGWTLYRRCNVSPVKYELVFYIPEDDVLSQSCVERCAMMQLWPDLRQCPVICLGS
jgi:hypothetical protein